MITRAILVAGLLLLGYQLYRRLFIEKRCRQCKASIHRDVQRCPVCGEMQSLR